MTSWKINELLREFPETNVIEPNEIYSVPLRLSSITHCSVLINLPPTAGPNSPPILFCEPAITGHSMIEKDGMVKLADGMGTDGDLVSILRRIFQLYSKNESYNNNNSSGALSNAMNTTQNTQNNYMQNTQNNHQQQQQQQQQQHYKFDLSLIDSLTEVQVNNLLEDEGKFRKFLSNFQHIQSEQKRLIEDVRGNVLEKAQGNLNLKKEIDALATKLDETHEKYTEDCQSYRNLLVLNSSTLTSLNPENVLTEIQVNLMELNDSSNDSIKCALNSTENGNNLDLVLKECVKLRKEYHSKAILLQKLQQQ